MFNCFIDSHTDVVNERLTKVYTFSNTHQHVPGIGDSSHGKSQLSMTMDVSSQCAMNIHRTIQPVQAKQR